MVSIRPATPADGTAVARLHEAAIRERGPAAYDEAQVEAWAANKDPDRYPIDDPDSHFVVAARVGTIVGFGELVPDEREVRAVYVHPNHADDGVGTAILDHLEETAREEGIERLELLSSKNAVGFYEHRGWEPVEAVDHESTGGVVLECTRLAKRLDGG